MAETSTTTENPPTEQHTEDSTEPTKEQPTEKHPTAPEPQTNLYFATLEYIPPAISALLATYSSIPQSQQKDHILSARDQAYKHHAYPCLGRFRFLQLDLSTHPLYTTHLLPHLTTPAQAFHPPHDPIFLDIGVCLGQDLRKLAVDGVPVHRLHGSDLGWGMIDAGYELFRDEDKFPRDRFLVPGDVLAGSSLSSSSSSSSGSSSGGGENALDRMRGKCDAVNAIAVFHLFDRPEQVVMAREMVRLLRRKGDEKKLLLGQQLGMWEGGVMEKNGRTRYRHDEGTWKRLWDEVFESKEWNGVVAKWEVGGKLQTLERKDANVSYAWQVWWVWVVFQ